MDVVQKIYQSLSGSARNCVLKIVLTGFCLAAICSALPAVAAPTSPAGLTAITGNAEASLTWNVSTGASCYLLYRSTTSGGPYSFVAQTQGTSHTDHGLGNGSPYYYVVTALDGSGQSSYSAEVTVTPSANVLPAPTNVTVTAGNGQASLTWSPVTSAVAYNVYRAAAQGGPYTLLPTPAPGPSFTDTGLVNDTQYYYVVQSLSPNSGAWSDEVNVIPSVQLPVAPVGLVATPGSTWARLTWSASAGATGYGIFRSTTVGGPYTFAGFSPTTEYEESGLPNNTTYYYVVAAQNAKGRGAFSVEQSAAVSDIERPHATVLSATLSGSGYVSLHWENSAGAVSYRVYRATIATGPYTDLGVQSTGYTNVGLTNGITYYYVVDALNASSTVARSNEVSAIPALNGTPPVPSNIAVVPGNTQVTVTWNPVPGATGYYVVVASSPGGPNISGGSPSGPNYTVTGLTNGQTYYFRVQSGGGGYSAFSAEVSATPLVTLPLAPTGVNINGGNSQLSLTWPAVVGATGYQIYRRTDGNPWPATPLGTATGTLYNDGGLSNGTPYQYLVAAVNAAGVGAWSYSATGKPMADNRTSAPVTLAVIPGNTQATVTWDPVPGASGYFVTASTSPGGIGSFSGYPSDPNYTVTGLTNGTTYYFRVQAIVRDPYASAFSAEVNATPSASLPLAPTGLSINVGNSQLTLTWAAVTGATSYKIYRRTGENPWLTPLGTATGTIYNDSGLSNGTTYQYLVAAVKAAGAGAWSATANGKPTASNRTTAPVNVAVTAGYTQATVTWDPVSGATSYYVIVASSPGGPNISGGSPSGLNYTATGLTNGQTYYFRVQAGSPTNQYSAYSVEVSAVPSISRLLAPTGVNISSGNTQLTLTWSAVPGAANYRVYRRTVGTAWSASPVATPATNTYTDTELVNGTTYYYVVATATGAWSGEVSAVPADTTLPDTTITDKPTNPSTSITADFSFTSTKPDSIFQCQLDGSAYEACTSPMTYTGLAAGSHTFAVKATDNVGNVDPSPASYTWTVDTTITVPTGTITINSGATITDTPSVTLALTCTDPDGCSQLQLSNDSSNWSAAEAYVTTKSWTLLAGDGIKTVYVKFKDGGGYWSNVFSDTITLNTASKALIVNRTGTGKGTVTSAPEGITCGTVCQNSFASSTLVTLSAVADARSVFVAWGGDCSGTSTGATIVLNDLKICTAQFNSTAPTPTAPANLTAITGNGEASLSWDPSAGASWYILYRSTTSGGPYSFVAQTQGTGVTDHGLGNGTSYYYVVTALNDGGQSVYSAEATVTPTTAVLPAPINVTVVAGNGQASLTWDNVTSEVVYNVYRATTQGGPYTLLTPSAPGPSFTDTGLVNDTQYYYVVQTLSTNSGAWSVEVSVVPTAQLPPAPTDVVATPGSTWASLTWSPSVGATGYGIYRSTTVGGPYTFAGFSPTTEYEESGLPNNTTYYYVIAAQNAKGRGAFSVEQSAAVSDIERPHATVLSATLSGSGYVSLHWENSAGATSYKVYRGTSSGGPYTDLGVQSTGYANGGLTNGITYYYVVDTLNASSTVARSNEVSATPALNGAPPVPGNIAVVPGNTQATVTWNPVPGASGYFVIVSTSTGGAGIFSGSPSDPSYTVTGLTNGQTYYFRVQAGGSGYSAFSAEVSTTPLVTLPLAPTGVNITGGNSQLSLTWPAVAGATGYQIYRRTDGNPWPATPLGTATGTLYNDSGLINGTPYQYLVAAVNAAGVGAWSYSATGKPMADNRTSAPVTLAVIPGNTQATVTWDPVPGASGYFVTASTSPGGIGSFSGYPSDPNYTVTGLTNGTTYYFRVQAIVRDPYASAFSAEVNATPSASLPLAPTGLSINVGNSQLTLTWTAVTGATSYKIYRRTGENPWLTPLGTATGTLYNDSGLSNGTTYQYLVAAVKAAGAGAWSVTANGKPTASNRTTAPVNVAVTAGYTQATVTWDPVPGAISYFVIVSSSPGGPNISGGSPSGLNYTATGLTNGQTYYFRVQAGSPTNQYSAYSVEVSAVPSISRLLAPTGLNIAVGINRRLDLTWSPVSGAMSYMVYRRNADTSFTLVGSSLTSAYTDNGLANGTRYYYVVEAVSLGGPGAWSSEATAIPVDTTPPTGTIIINSGAAYTTMATVNLALTCTDDSACAQMQFSNDSWDWSTAETYTSAKSWGLSAGVGSKTVFVRFLDTAGNWSASFSDSIAFDSSLYTLTAAIVGEGSVVSTPEGLSCSGNSCSGSFAFGTSVSLTPHPTSGSIFTGWSGACTGMGPCSVTMDAAKSVTATFTSGQNLSATIAGTGGGTVNSITPGVSFTCGTGTCVTTFAPDTSLTVRATPDINSLFTGWSGACTGTDDCSLTMSSPRTLTATFTQSPRVRVLGGDDYGTLIAAYGAVGAGGTIQTRSTNFSETLLLNRGITFILTGGYDSGFGANSGWTTLTGTFTVGTGSVTLEKIEIK